MYLDIDVGNTRAKWRLCGSECSAVGACMSSLGALRELLDQQMAEVDGVRIVAVKSEGFCRELEQYCLDKLKLPVQFAKTHAQSKGVVNGYLDPGSMGVDRWSAIVAASACHHASHAREETCSLYAVVDAGSALTLDFIALREGHEKHLGGYIIPGFSMQIESLLGGTQRIALEGVASSPSIELGNNTHDAVYSGVIAGMVALIGETIKRVERTQSSEPTIYLTGGDAPLLKPFLTHRVAHKPNLVLDGIPLLMT